MEPKRRRGRPKKTDKPVLSDDILLTALRHFSQKGFDGTSVREICVELGVSHNLINDRFGTKDALWRATVDRWIAEILSGIQEVVFTADPTLEPIEMLRKILVRFIELNAARPEVVRLMNIESSTDSDRLDYCWDKHVLPFYQLLSRYYKAVHGVGLIRSYPPAVFFFLFAHGSSAIFSSPALARKILEEDSVMEKTSSNKKKIPDLADPKHAKINAEFIADLLLTPPD